MTPELWAALIGALVLLLTNLAGLVKVWQDLAKQKTDRAETKATRDKDSLELHDAVQKATWEIGAIRDTLKLHADRILDSEQQIAIIVREMAVISTKLDNIIDLVKGNHHDSTTS